MVCMWVLLVHDARKAKGMKRKIFDIIEPDRNNSVASRIFDRVVAFMIVASVVVVFATTFDLAPRTLDILLWIENFASVVFSVEYVLRIWTANLKYPKMSPLKARLRYMSSSMAIIDLLAILPFWLPMFLPSSLLGVRAIRLVRLLRILKFNRYFDAMRSLGDVIASKRRELIGSIFFVSLLMLVSSLLMYAAEHDAQPHVFKNAFSGLWWAVATLTTVGYGDIYPITTLGRILGAVIALSGVAALAIPTGIVTSGLMERVGRKEFRDEVKTRKGKDAEHDRLIAEQSEVLKSLVAQIQVLGEKLDKLQSNREGDRAEDESKTSS